METYLDMLARLLARLASPLFLLGVLITGVEVAMRYLFNAPTIWAHEATTFLVGVAFLLGGFYAANRGAQISISSFYDLLPVRWQARLDLVGALVSFLCFSVLAYACVTPAWRALSRWETTGTAWNPPIPALLLPLLFLAALLLALQGLADTVARLRALRTGAGR